MPLRAFEETVLPHLDATFNYARWLMKNSAEAPVRGSGPRWRTCSSMATCRRHQSSQFVVLRQNTADLMLLVQYHRLSGQQTIHALVQECDAVDTAKNGV
jgi:hypothetical protein